MWQFQTKTAMVKKILGKLQFPVPCKVYLLADAWFWSKDLAKVCRQQGCHMISQLKSNATLLVGGKSIQAKKLAAQRSLYRELTLPLYGENTTLKIKKVLGEKKGFGKWPWLLFKRNEKTLDF